MSGYNQTDCVISIPIGKMPGLGDMEWRFDENHERYDEMCEELEETIEAFLKRQDNWNDSFEYDYVGFDGQEIHIIMYGYSDESVVLEQLERQMQRLKEEIEN